MNTPRHDRRAWGRWNGADCAWIVGARLRHGFDVLVIDLCPEGALVEGTARLLPGASVELHLAAAEWTWAACARVLRCYVSAVIPERGVRYRAALQFDRRLQPPIR